MNGAQFREFVSEVKSRGFTHVMTYGGPVALDEWHPYGLFGGVNDKDDTYVSPTMRWTWVTECSARDGDAPDPPLAAGVWAFVAMTS